MSTASSQGDVPDTSTDLSNRPSEAGADATDLDTGKSERPLSIRFNFWPKVLEDGERFELECHMSSNDGEAWSTPATKAPELGMWKTMASLYPFVVGTHTIVRDDGVQKLSQEDTSAIAQQLDAATSKTDFKMGEIPISLTFRDPLYDSHNADSIKVTAAYNITRPFIGVLMSKDDGKKDEIVTLSTEPAEEAAQSILTNYDLWSTTRLSEMTQYEISKYPTKFQALAERMLINRFRSAANGVAVQMAIMSGDPSRVSAKRALGYIQALNEFPDYDEALKKGSYRLYVVDDPAQDKHRFDRMTKVVGDHPEGDTVLGQSTDTSSE